MNSAYDHLAVGLPHSDIRGSTIARISPRLFAACYVLHRLLVPRHPPNALQRLISTFPRNHPGCLLARSKGEPGRPISLLIPLQPRQPPQDARTHNSALAKPSTGIPALGLPPRSPDAQFSFKHSTLFQKPAIAQSQDRSPHPHDKTAASKSKRQYPLHHVKQHKLPAEAGSPTASSTTPWILALPIRPTTPSPSPAQRCAGGGGRD